MLLRQKSPQRASPTGKELLEENVKLMAALADATKALETQKKAALGLAAKVQQYESTLKADLAIKCMALQDQLLESYQQSSALKTDLTHQRKVITQLEDALLFSYRMYAPLALRHVFHAFREMYLSLHEEAVRTSGALCPIDSGENVGGPGVYEILMHVRSGECKHRNSMLTMPGTEKTLARFRLEGDAFIYQRAGLEIVYTDGLAIETVMEVGKFMEAAYPEFYERVKGAKKVVVQTREDIYKLEMVKKKLD